MAQWNTKYPLKLSEIILQMYIWTNLHTLVHLLCDCACNLCIIEYLGVCTFISYDQMYCIFSLCHCRHIEFLWMLLCIGFLKLLHLCPLKMDIYWYRPIITYSISTHRSPYLYRERWVKDWGNFVLLSWNLENRVFIQGKTGIR